MITNKTNESQQIIDEYFAHLAEKHYPCAGAKAAMALQQVHCIIAGDMARVDEADKVLHFLYAFVDEYQKAGTLYHSAVVIYQQPLLADEETFDRHMWAQLQALHDADSVRYAYDHRVSADPASPRFSYSIMGEAFFVIGLHSRSNRLSRRFRYPALVFNPHQQFEQLKQLNKYDALKNVIRNRDMAYCGSLNPMLDDYGLSSEALQYSGRQYDRSWTCPLIIKNQNTI